MAKRFRFLIVPIIICVIAAGISLQITQIKSADPYSGVLVVQMGLDRGSCFVVAHQDDWWYAITARHVVSMFPFITVDEEQYNAEIVQIGSEKDIALIRFKSPETYWIYSLASARVGESCTTVGWGYGSRLVYKGHIVSLDFKNCIVSNSGIVPGCSGGALLNGDGRVIGVTIKVPVYRARVFDNTVLYTPSRYVRAMLIATEIGEE